MSAHKFSIHPQHLAKLRELFPATPDQKAVGDSPLSYCRRLEEVTGLKLKMPSGITDDALSRDDLRELCRKSSTKDLVCYAAVMAWGGRGVKSRNYCISLEGDSLDNLKKALAALRKSQGSRQQDFEDFQTAAWDIKGLKVSFYTKLLFFLRKDRKGDAPAYILDQFTAKSAKMLFPECPLHLTSGNYPHPNTLPKDYEWFCAALEHLGRQLDPSDPWTGEEVEMALFDERGGDWRKYVNSFFAVQRGNRKRFSSTCSKTSPTKALSHRLAEIVAAEHIRSYGGGLDMPTPNASVTAEAKINCGNLNGLNWQYVVIGREVRAAVFIPSNQVLRYDALRKHLGVTGHDFGGGIQGTGFKGGDTCTITYTISDGSSAPESQWPGLAKAAVAGMNELFVTIDEII